MQHKTIRKEQYLTDHGRIRYERMCHELMKENDKLNRELDTIPRLIRDLCAKLRGK